MLGNALPGIRYLHGKETRFFLFTYVNHKIPALGHGIDGVDKQVEKYLYQKLPVAIDRRKVGGDIFDEFNFRKFGLVFHQLDCLVDEFIEI